MRNRSCHHLLLQEAESMNGPFYQESTRIHPLATLFNNGVAKHPRL
jgi:hypothetical protein